MEEQIRDVIAQLDRRQVRYVVVDEMWTPEFEHILFPKLERSFLQGRLMEYVRKQYRLDGSLSEGLPVPPRGLATGEGR
jgi:hypothetical protein